MAVLSSFLAHAETQDSAEAEVPAMARISRFHPTTDLLQWAALAPNVGIRYDLDSRNSIALTYGCAWWSRLSHNRVYRWLNGSVDFLHYFNDRTESRGFMAGAYAHGGDYEMMFSAKNREGEFFGAGVTGGYRWRLSDSFTLEAQAGVGVMAMKYKYAWKIEDILIYSGKQGWHPIVFPRARVTLVYDFNKKKRK